MLHLLNKIIWGWTAFTSVFLWTVANRGLWRPSISSASIGAEGVGRTVTFWIVICLIPYVLVLFYLQGRRVLFALRAAMLLLWHMTITALFIWLTLRTGGEAVFVGQTWGWQLSLRWIAAFSALMTTLSALVIYRTKNLEHGVPMRSTSVNYKRLIVLLVFTPFIAALFQYGAGYDWSGRLATALAIMQWLGILISIEGDAD